MLPAIWLAERRSIEINTLEDEVVHFVGGVVVVKEDMVLWIITRTREGHADELAF